MRINSKKKQPEILKISKRKRFLFHFLAISLSLLIFFLIVEILLRLIPIPGIHYNYNKYDDFVGVIMIPHSTVIYYNGKSDCVRKKVNSWGYLDIEHKKEKADGIYRIGFFGDSYTESIQVPLESTVKTPSVMAHTID